jgi:hypothetical protein
MGARFEFTTAALIGCTTRGLLSEADESHAKSATAIATFSTSETSKTILTRTT